MVKDHISGISCARMLSNEYLRTVQEVHRRIVSVNSAARRQDAVLLGTANAGDTDANLARQHRIHAIGCGLREAPFGHIFGITRKVCARPPQSCALCASSERLESRLDDGVNGVRRCAMEAPSRVHPCFKTNTLVVDVVS